MSAGTMIIRITALLLPAIALTAACSSDPAVEKQQHFTRAEAYAADGKLPEAIIEYRSAIQIDPNFGDARRRLAVAYERSGNIEAAFQEHVRAADILKENLDTQLVAGQYLLIAGRFDEARAKAMLALERDPNNAQAHLLLGNAWAGLKNYDESVRILQQAIDADPNRGMSYAALAAVEAVRGNQKEAEAAFSRAVAAEPKGLAPRLALGNYRMAMGQLAEAEKEFLAAAAIDPQSPLPPRALTSVYFAMGQPQRAEPHLLTLADAHDDPSATLALADLYASTKRIPDATRRLQALAAKPGQQIDATLRLAAIEFAAGRKAEAFGHLDTLLKAQPNAVKALAMRGRFQLADNQVPQAIETLSAAVAADAKYAPGHYWLAQAHLRARRQSEARAALVTVLQLEPTFVPAQIEMSRLHLAANEFDKALEFARQASAAAPNNVAARLTLPRALIAAGQIPAAAQALLPLSKALPNDTRVQLVEGQLALARRDPGQAERAFRRALASQPASVDAMDGLLISKMAEGDASRAVLIAGDAVARSPEDARILVVSARAFALAKDFAKAESTLRAAIERDPQLMEAYSMLGQIYMRQNRADDALREFQRLADLQPNEVGPRTVVGVLQHAAGKTSEARQSYEAVLRLDPSAVVAANNLAWMTMEEGGNLDVALQLAQAATQRAPASGEVRDTLGRIYYRKGLYPSAIAAFEEGVKLDPKNADYRVQLAMGYAKNGDAAKAKATLSAALAMNPAAAGAAEAQALVATGR
jgi:putative PEP-CTERM system TPR-repeat lipoprotein